MNTDTSDTKTVPTKTPMSCEEFSILMIAGVPQGRDDFPALVRAHMNLHLLSCKYHRSREFTGSALSTPVTAKIASAAEIIISKYRALPIENPAGIEVLEQSETEKTYPCGHSGPESFRINIFGESTDWLKKRPECLKCLITRLNTHAIRCGLCGKSILPGSGVALYDVVLNPEVAKHEDIGTFIDDRTVLGCMRFNCCISGAFFGGNWTEQGYVQR